MKELSNNVENVISAAHQVFAVCLGHRFALSGVLKVSLWVRFELVQAKRSNFCHPRMLLATSTRMSHVSRYTDLHEQQKRVTWPVF